MTTRVISYPYLRPDPDLISAGSWQDSDTGATVGSETFRDWDPARDLTFSRNISVDLDGIIEESGLGDSATIGISGYWHSAGTSLASDNSVPLPVRCSQAGNRDLETVVIVKVPGAEVSRQLTLGVAITVIDPGTEPSPLAASMPGSILWQDRIAFPVEGLAPRFPVEVTTFPPNEDKAAWHLSIDQDLYQPLLGGVRLYLNASHASLMEALRSRRPDAGQKAILSALYFDIGRQMASYALRHDEFMDSVRSSTVGPPYAAETTGRALWALLTAIADRRDIVDLARLLESAPVDFERLMQHSLRIFESDQP